jgi:hypothetical protein
MRVMSEGGAKPKRRIEKQKSVAAEEAEEEDVGIWRGRKITGKQSEWD